MKSFNSKNQKGLIKSTIGLCLNNSPKGDQSAISNQQSRRGLFVFSALLMVGGNVWG